MGKITVSKVGARFQHHADKDIFLNRVIDEEKKPEKKPIQKKTPKKAILEFDNGELKILPVEDEDENLIGVSD